MNGAIPAPRVTAPDGDLRLGRPGACRGALSDDLGRDVDVVHDPAGMQDLPNSLLVTFEATRRGSSASWASRSTCAASARTSTSTPTRARGPRRPGRAGRCDRRRRARAAPPLPALLDRRPRPRDERQVAARCSSGWSASTARSSASTRGREHGDDPPRRPGDSREHEHRRHPRDRRLVHVTGWFIKTVLDKDRDAERFDEDDARTFFDEHGHWPAEAWQPLQRMLAGRARPSRGHGREPTPAPMPAHCSSGRPKRGGSPSPRATTRTRPASSTGSSSRSGSPAPARRARPAREVVDAAGGARRANGRERRRTADRALASLPPEARRGRCATSCAGLAATSRPRRPGAGPAPTYFAVGRMSRASRFCSRMCADQPATRAQVNIDVNRSAGTSAMSSTTADQNSTFVARTRSGLRALSSASAACSSASATSKRARAELARGAAQDAGARVLGAVDAVAEAHEPLAAVQRVLDLAARRRPAARPRRASSARATARRRAAGRSARRPRSTARRRTSAPVEATTRAVNVEAFMPCSAAEIQ